MKYTSIADQICRDGYVLTHSMGVSMRPMLTQRTEQLLIEKLTDQARKNDVLLYRRSNGQYVLHRVIRVRKEYYLIRGDNCYGKPEKVGFERAIGILKGFYRDEHYIDCKKSRGYRAYVFLWRLSYPARFLGYECYRFLCGAINKLRR